MTRSPLPPGWQAAIGSELDQKYMRALRAFLVTEKQSGKTIYPRSEDVFGAYHLTDLDQVKVVILGQDPYHGPGQAHGLCFSVEQPTAPPPSLKNIFKELSTDLNCPIPPHGNLTAWAEQGVLLLNSVLTVEHASAGSHANRGWEQFTDATVQTISRHCEQVVFLLWGAYAQKKGQWIDGSRHQILNAPHPSPLSAHRGFVGCRHFSSCNDLLMAHKRLPIDWCL